MFKKILLGLVVLVAGFAGFVALQPSEFRVERSATIAAPASDVFGQVNDFHNWEAWSPWAKLDPESAATFAGPAAGKDAAFTWSGNDKVGEGTMTVTESRPNDLVRIRIDFERPFKGTNTAEFTFEPDGKETAVTWSMTGRKNFVQKAVCLFMNMDKMVGGEFEKGLAQMKSVVEGANKVTRKR